MYWKKYSEKWIDEKGKGYLIPLRGLVAEYYFQEGTGTLLADISDKCNHGSLYGPTWISLPSKKKALRFDGDDYVRIEASNTYKPTTAITLIASIRPLAYTLWGKILCLDYRADGTWNPPYTAWEIGWYSDTKTLTFALTIDGSHYHHQSAFEIPLNEWTNVAVTYDNTKVSWYLNGQLDIEYNRTGNIDYGTSKDLVIGTRSPYSLGEYFQGDIALIYIYDLALRRIEIRSLHEFLRALVER